MPATLPAPVTAPVDWTLCPQCQTLIYGKRFERSLYVCPDCNRHAPLTAEQRLDLLLDNGSVEALAVAATAVDPLDFVDTKPYPPRLREARAKTGLDEADRCVAR